MATNTNKVRKNTGRWPGATEGEASNPPGVGEQTVYGIWLSKHEQWLMENGLIVSSDFIGLTNAYLKFYLKNGGTLAEVKRIGVDGMPVEESE